MTTSTTRKTRKRLIEYLPAIYQDPGLPQQPNILPRLLLAFDRLLLEGEWAEQDFAAIEEGLGIEHPPLEREVAHLHLLFDPRHSPKEFLPWLAGWAALAFQPELSEARRRKLLSQIISLYRIRGTRTYLEDVLSICLHASAAVIDTEAPMFQVGLHSTVDVDTFLGGGPAHYFRVRLVAPGMNESQLETEIALAAKIIDLAKPAHTYYELEVVSASMQLGVHATIGVDTIVGPPGA